MILKSALKQFKKNIFMSSLIIIQLSAVMIILSMLVSMIESRMEYYTPFADEINSKGFLCEMDASGVASEKEMLKNLKGTKCEFTYYGYYAVNTDSDDVTMENENTYVPLTDLLTERWIEAYTPKMQSGSWLSNIPDDDYIHAVVTQDNVLGLKTGDIITLNSFEGKTAQAKVIGVMENKQYAVGYSLFSQTDLANKMNFFDMYYTYNSEVENQWGLFIPKSEIEKSTLHEGDFTVWGMGFVLCDGMSGSEVKEVSDYLTANCSPMYTIPLEEVRDNSFEYIRQELYVLMPIALCIFLLTLITTVSVICISVNGQLKTYAIYYICGAKWHECALISFLYALILCLISWLISSAVISAIIYNSLTVIKLGFFELGIMLFSAVIYLILSSVLPMIIMHNNQPKDILK